MEIKYQNILLRDARESDIADDIRWNTTETAWALWDAPWEMEEELRRFDPAAYRQKELEALEKPPEGCRWRLELDTTEGVHIGSVSRYCLDGDFSWTEAAPGADPRALRWAVGLDICESAYWSGGWGTQALTAFVRYLLSQGYEDLYTQTWSGNVRMVGLAEKLGFRECRRKAGLRLVRGKIYDGLTFRLDRDAFAAHCVRAGLELYVPRAEDLWFVRRMQEDPATMAYNAGWDVSYEGYHPDTGCIDLPESAWAEKHANLVGHEPDQFYALVRERDSGSFVGEVNFHRVPEGWHEIGGVVYAPCRGRGYGHAALELLLRRAFVDWGLPKLRNAFEETRSSALAIHLRAGFRRVGITEDRRFGGRVRVLELELTREDYLADRGLGNLEESV